ncbi:MAG: hypothetical protein GC171_08505 [Terrimonas sp.]|nr:hypothetical protein [Terrimonas sp.]
MNEQNQSLETLQDIKRIMERSSRFISLSGLSGIAAGICALVGAYFARQTLNNYYIAFRNDGYRAPAFRELENSLIVIALAVLAAALVTAFFFTWRKAKQDQQPVWNSTSRRLTVNMLIPLVSGGIFILTMLQYNEWRFVAPASLIFYGMALIHASKYTVTDIRYLGYCEIIIGLLNTQWVGKGLYFWALGFGVLHIIYGVIMWVKYERN